MECWELVEESGSLTLALNFVSVRLNYDENFIALRGLRFVKDFYVNFREGCKKIMIFNVYFGCRLSICTMTKKNHVRVRLKHK